MNIKNGLQFTQIDTLDRCRQRLYNSAIFYASYFRFIILKLTM